MPSLPNLRRMAMALQAPELGAIVCGPTEAEAKLQHLMQMVDRIHHMTGCVARAVESNLPQ